MPMNAHFLRQKEGPFLLMLLVAIAAWLIAHTVDRLRSGPIVEYRLEENWRGKREVRCRIENLCVDRCFRNLKFTLIGPRRAGQFFTNCQVVLFPPGETSDEPSPPSPNEAARQLSVAFPEFHPGWQVE